MTALGRIVDSLGGALFPPHCPGCGAETGVARSLCPACWRATEFTAGPCCDACGRPEPALIAPDPTHRCDACRADPPGWDRGREVFLYRGTGRRLVLALKHGDRLDMVPMIGAWMARAGADLIDRADLVVPVPLHWTRRVRRRFNQSAEVARATLRHAGKAGIFAPGLLTRTRRTPSQEGRNRAERAANLAGAIGLARGAGARIAGRRVLLVDDVMTTGATLSAAASALKAGGAAGVDVLVIALVPDAATHYLRPSDETEETR